MRRRRKRKVRLPSLEMHEAEAADSDAILNVNPFYDFNPYQVVLVSAVLENGFGPDLAVANTCITQQHMHSQGYLVSPLMSA
jgi:hypothetical protein